MKRMIERIHSELALEIICLQVCEEIFIEIRFGHVGNRKSWFV